MRPMSLETEVDCSAAVRRAQCAATSLSVMVMLLGTVSVSHGHTGNSGRAGRGGLADAGVAGEVAVGEDELPELLGAGAEGGGGGE
jgi:hypothetical protein